MVELKEEGGDLIAQETIVGRENADIEIDPVVVELEQFLQMVPLSENEIVENFLIVKLEEDLAKGFDEMIVVIDEELKLIDQLRLEIHLRTIVRRTLITKIVVVAQLQVADVGT